MTVAEREQPGEGGQARERLWFLERTSLPPFPWLLLLVATVMSLAIAPAAAQQPKRGDDIQSEQRKLQQTQKQLKEQREKAAQARARETSLLAELEEIEKRLAEKQRQVARLDARIGRIQADVHGLRGEIDKLEGSRAGQEETLARRLRTAYKVHAQGGALPLILSGDVSTSDRAAKTSGRPDASR